MFDMMVYKMDVDMVDYHNKPIHKITYQVSRSAYNDNNNKTTL